MKAVWVFLATIAALTVYELLRRRWCAKCWRPFGIFTGKLCRRCWREA